MQCPHCQAENAGPARFCQQCGTPLSRTCPRCQAQLPLQARFCPQCGTALDAVPAPAPAQPAAGAGLEERLQKLLPREYVERLRATHGRVGHERRLVTILFSDIKGSTAMAEKLDPEEVLEIINGAMDALIAPIYRYEGTLARLMGDAILAFFGAPLAHEDDPERAVRAALEIVAGAQEYGARLERERGLAGFNVRVGINTGLVVVGEVGSDLRVEYTAIGDAINTAARMEQIAPVGGVLISHDTYRHVRGLFDVEAQPPATVKGKAEAVQTYRVRSARPRQFRMATRGLEGVETRLVGREAELIRLQDAFRDTVEEGQTHLLTLVGDAGVGKSRLLYEFENWLGLWPEPLTYLQGRAGSERQAHAYGVLRDLFATHLGIQETDSLAVVREKFVAGLAGYLPAGQAELIARLVGFDVAAVGAGGRRDVGQESTAELAWDCLTDYLSALSAERPTVLLLDDVHWADPASLDLVDRLVTALPHLRLLVICLARPALYERRPNWGEGREVYETLELRPLSRRSTRQLIAELLQKMAAVPPRLEEILLVGSEGNPYYAEELVKMLLETGVIETAGEEWRASAEQLEQLQVPPTLAGVLQARFDCLAAEEKAVLQQAAVVGREFWDIVLAELDTATSGADREGCLNALRERAMIFKRERSALDGAREYTFKHAMLHDAVYETVLLKERRLYHACVAAWLEGHTGERQAEYWPQIAHHYERAGQPARAAGYWRRAGEDAAAMGLDQEARAAFERALDLLPAEETVGRAELLERIGRSLLGPEHADQAQDVLQQALALARQSGALQVAADACLSLGITHFFFQEKVEQGASDIQESLDLARRSGDPPRIGEALTLTGLLQVFLNHPDEGEQIIEQSLPYYRQKAASNSGYTQALRILARRAADRGDVAQAQAYVDEALDFLARNESRHAGLRALEFQAAIAVQIGDDAAAERYAREALAAARQVGHRSSILGSLEQLETACRLQGHYAEAEWTAQQGVEYARRWDKRYEMQGFLVSWGQLAHLRGDEGLARRCFEEAVRTAPPDTDTSAWSAAGSFYAASGDWDAACRHWLTVLDQAWLASDAPSTIQALLRLLEPFVHHGWSVLAAEMLGLLQQCKTIVTPLLRRQYLAPALSLLEGVLPAEQLAAALQRGSETGLQEMRGRVLEDLRRD